ncbi:hypothetical protein VSR89_22390 [Klebsiella pneumoniae]|uniref:hypothetical protein n=1 Tax=Klebsiella pneumoniae TaxID=573 RepID=UPI002DB6CF6D|nr:hypothetical protein [Klebsiella pneumoniae]MEC4510808.1 hypothetical protein [Klebsiella pneumoniae]HDO6740635.1 hypothetical protein [Klebsiella pneumoniae]
MGRKSRLKKERRLLGTNSSPTDFFSTQASYQPQPPEIKLYSLQKKLPTKLYRFFDNESYANDFVDGKLRVSTLETCRNHENKAQGDPEEGYSRHYINRIDSSDPQFQEIAMRGGCHFVNCADITIENHTNTTIFEDAYILCTTTKCNPADFTEDFGRFCVEITNPYKMMELITKALISNNITRCICGEIQYRTRTFQQEEYPQVPIEFIKPDTDIYMAQNEFRFSWHTKDSPITPININCGSFSEFCRIIRQ